jgi:hypothetical protein
VTAVVAQPKLRAVAVSRAGDLAAGIGVATIVFALTLLTWHTWGDIGRDTGYDFVASTRVTHGEFPYVGYIYYYGPFAPLALGLIGLVVGTGIATFVGVGLLLTYAIVAATYALARTQTGPVGAALAAVATAAVAFSPTNLSYVVPHTYSESFGILFSLFFLLGLAAASSGRRFGTLVAGVAMGLVALTRPEFELGVIVAALAWFAARSRNGLGSRRDALSLAVPAAVIPAVVYGTFLGWISPHSLLFDNLYPSSTLRAGGNAIVRSQAPLTIHSFAAVGGYLVLYAAGAAALVLASRGLERLSRTVALALVAVVAAGILGVAAFDPEAARSRLEWIFGGVPAAAVLAVAWLVARHAFGQRRPDARDQTLLATLALLAVVALKTYSGFFFLATRAQPAVYAAPFVFVALTRLHLGELARSRSALLAGTAWLSVLALVCVGLTVKDAHAQSASVTGPGGTIRVTPAEAPLYRAAITTIVEQTRVGEPILVAPQLTTLYTLTKRTDPLTQISLVPGALPTPNAQRQAIETLARDHVRLILTDRHLFSEYGQSRFGVSFDGLLDRWIKRNFAHAGVLRGGDGVDHTLDVWIRRDS